jgi:hypothetical protein
MEYFAMKTNVTNPVEPVLLQGKEYTYSLTKESFARFPEMSVGYYEYKSDVILPDILQQPTFLVSENVKKVLLLYDDTLRCKSICIMPNREADLAKGMQTYHIMNFERRDCLAREAKILPNGTVEKVILDSARIPNMDVFMVDKTAENIVIVSLRLEESIARRNMLGIKFVPVEVR